MPSCYTAAIADGIDFEQFVMRCARAMGACILMRDAPLDAPIPERFEPSDYHSRKLAEAKDALTKLRTMSPEEAEAAAGEVFEKAASETAEALERHRALRAKYEAMLFQVKAWAPPTSDHEGFKSFMVKQLKEAIHFDCSEDYYADRTPTRQSGEEWRATRIAQALHDIDYHTREHAEEVSRTESRNVWISALRASLAAGR